MEQREIKAILKRLENRLEDLSPYQAELVKGIKKYYTRNNKISPKQLDALINIENLVLVK